MNSARTIELSERYAAHNYHPLPVVIEEAQGVWVKSPEGKSYMDFLSAYSALNHGHRHPKLVAALKEQADKVTLTSRAFHSTAAGEFYEKLARYTGKSRLIAMNTGAEAVETALKAVRRWAYRVKGCRTARRTSSSAAAISTDARSPSPRSRRMRSTRAASARSCRALRSFRTAIWRRWRRRSRRIRRRSSSSRSRARPASCSRRTATCAASASCATASAC